MVDVNDILMNDTPETGGVNTIFAWVHQFYRTMEYKMNEQMAEIRTSIRTSPAPTVPLTPEAPPVPFFTFTIFSELRKKIFPKLLSYHGIKTKFRFWFTQAQTKLNVDLNIFRNQNDFGISITD